MRGLAPVVLLLCACGGGADAIALIAPRSGSVVQGSAVFALDGESVTLNLAIEGALPGKRGIHLHEKGDCTAPDGMSAGPHWNPTGEMHGDPSAEAHHAGDLGNLDVDAQGRATLTYTTTEWTIGSETSTATDVLGRAIIIHGNADEFTQPAGNAGPRVGCGVVTAAE